jgi:hypothetical protein
METNRTTHLGDLGLRLSLWPWFIYVIFIAFRPG